MRNVNLFRIRAGLCAAVMMGWSLAAAADEASQPHFPTPEAALDALRASLDAEDSSALVNLLGPENKDDIVGGDAAQARNVLDQARAAADRGLKLEPGEAPDTWTVVIGSRDWPLPFPLVKEAAGWRFDTEAGLDEIVDRRIGENELTAIANMRAYVDAQVEYAGEDHDGDEVLEYAQRILSTPGKQDGLYWRTEPGQPLSPLGPLAQDDADYTQYMEAGDSYHGYEYKVLAAQGANPPGGAYDYVINGNMIAGFGLIAWPTDYGNSGIMTFIVNHQGRVYEKDLGPDTAKIAQAIGRYDPDASWTRLTETQ
ncbi:MAG: DUF2950 domain-containing protein [Geminicoccaceae bacterium]